mmetsp:Transcript_41160/g.87675  ORF Transcript_41160/g.87675 Transcript_41160/m.87675 type:complete len:208 (+) Transcript_41160:338-961(+)
MQHPLAILVSRCLPCFRPVHELHLRDPVAHMLERLLPEEVEEDAYKVLKPCNRAWSVAVELVRGQEPLQRLSHRTEDSAVVAEILCDAVVVGRRSVDVVAHIAVGHLDPCEVEPGEPRPVSFWVGMAHVKDLCCRTREPCGSCLIDGHRKGVESPTTWREMQVCALQAGPTSLRNVHILQAPRAGRVVHTCGDRAIGRDAQRPSSAK